VSPPASLLLWAKRKICLGREDKADPSVSRAIAILFPLEWPEIVGNLSNKDVSGFHRSIVGVAKAAFKDSSRVNDLLLFIVRNIMDDPSAFSHKRRLFDFLPYRWSGEQHE